MQSSAVEDLSSLEAVRARIAREPTDDAKAKEIFRLTSRFRDQYNPAREHLAHTDHVHDPIKIFNVYGYCQCCCAAAAVAALGRDSGLKARGWALVGHSVSELEYDGRPHMFDPSLINYFVTDEGHVASVDELARGRDRMFDARYSPFIDAKGWYPARTHRASVEGPKEYDPARIGPHEHLFTVGYRAGVTLRSGEVLERRWSNEGRYLNEDDPNPYHPSLTTRGAEGNQAFLDRFFPGYRMGLVGNGILAWEPELASGRYRAGILSETNLAATEDDGRAPALHLAAPGRGEAIFPVTSAYVFLGGTVRVRAIRPQATDRVELALSLNHGLDWTPIWAAGRVGEIPAEIDLTPWIRRRYHYLLRVSMEGGAPGLDALHLSHAIQHSQRALPLLMEGDNTLTLRSDGPRLATRTLEGALANENAFNATFLDFHPEVVNLAADGILRVRGGDTGRLTFRVPVPGEVKAVRFGGAFRLKALDGGIRLLVSDDGGATWKTAADIEGPRPDTSRFVTFTDIAPGRAEVLIRYELYGPQGVQLHTFRADVDYEDAAATPIPVRVRYEWTEHGTLRSDDRVIERLPATWTIRAGADPIMRSLRLEGL